MIDDLEIIEVKSEPEALLLEGKLIKQWRPKYNTDFTDDKRFLLVRIDLEAEMPRFVLTRFKKDDPLALFRALRPLRPAAQDPRARCARSSACCSPTPTRSSSPTARGSSTTTCAPNSTAGPTPSLPRNIAHASCRPATSSTARAASGSASLRAEMKARAAKQEFEKAAELRDVVLALETDVVAHAEIHSRPDEAAGRTRRR
ncbi:MAG: UvrB/UvrC motif-containing protein [Pirellulales bacterium]